MTTQTLALQLPDALLQRLQRMAAITRRPLDTLVVQTLDNNLPKLPAHLPQTVQDELSNLEKLEDEVLWTVADSQYDHDKQIEYRELLHKNSRGLLSEDEKGQMNMHLESVERLTLQKSYAYLLLKWRGHPLPTLNELQKRH